MLREDFEYRIALYADGTLPASERAALEAEIAGDADAQAALSDYRKLHAAINYGAGLSVNWDQLQEHLCGAIAQATAESTAAESIPHSLDEQTEYSISCFADGTLLGDEWARIEQLIATDSQAHVIFDEHQNVIATLRAIAQGSALRPDGEELTRMVSTAITAGSAALADMSEVTEQRIADYAADDVSPDDRTTVEAQLGTDAAARVVLSQYAAVDQAIKSIAIRDPVPAVNWDLLAERISTAVDAAPAETVLKAERTTGSYPIWKYFTRPLNLAVAAMIAIIVGVSVDMARKPAKVQPFVQSVAPKLTVAQVEAARVDVPAGPVVDEVVIGPPKDKDVARADSEGSDDVVSHPSRAFVASGQSSPRAPVVPASPF